eukprot:SAG11_NODE_47_length_20431_cov_7.472752_21_plen_42_part_00
MRFRRGTVFYTIYIKRLGMAELDPRIQIPSRRGAGEIAIYT